MLGVLGASHPPRTPPMPPKGPHALVHLRLFTCDLVSSKGIGPSAYCEMAVIRSCAKTAGLLSDLAARALSHSLASSSHSSINRCNLDESGNRGCALRGSGETQDVQGTGMLLGRGDKRTWRGKVSGLPPQEASTLPCLAMCCRMMPAAMCLYLVPLPPPCGVVQIFKGSFGKVSLLAGCGLSSTQP